MAPSDRKLIFITGASRSGTTLLSFVLRNHSDLFGLKELHFFGGQWDPRTSADMTDAQLISAIASIYKFQAEGILTVGDASAYKPQASALVRSLPENQRNAADAFAAAVCQLAAATGKSIPCEQTPRNIFYAEALLKAFPNAYVVHIVRDPRAVMASQKKRWQRRNLSTDTTGVSRYQALRVWVNYHPLTIARLWRRATEVAARLAGTDRFTAIRFEDLVNNGEATVRKLCEDLKVDFQPEMLDVGRVNSSHESSVGGAKKGLHPDAIDMWRKTLGPAEIAITEKLCATQMRQYNYAPFGTTLSIWSNLGYRVSYILHLIGVMLINPKRAIVQFRALIGAGRANG